ncbi:hypothetical protein Tco_0023594, partial [Tanacetum coccineum]
MFFNILVLEETNRSCYIHYRIRIRKRRKQTALAISTTEAESLIRHAITFIPEVNKDCSVAVKLNAPFTASFRRQTRGGPEAQQLEQLTNLLDSVSLSNMEDRCFWDLNGERVFQVKDVRSVLDETFLPKENIPTRWVKSIPIKVAKEVLKLICRWWDLVLYDFDNYDGWLLWFKSIRLGSKLK